MQKMFKLEIRIVIYLYTSSVKRLSFMKNSISLRNNEKKCTMNNIFMIILVFSQEGNFIEVRK